MKDKEKQIEEMAKVINETDMEYGFGTLRLNERESKDLAEALLPLIKQYQEQAVKEFVNKAKSRIREHAFHKKVNGEYQNEWTDCLSYNDDIRPILDETLKEVIGEKE